MPSMTNLVDIDIISGITFVVHQWLSHTNVVLKQSKISYFTFNHSFTNHPMCTLQLLTDSRIPPSATICSSISSRAFISFKISCLVTDRPSFPVDEEAMLHDLPTRIDSCFIPKSQQFTVLLIVLLYLEQEILNYSNQTNFNISLLLENSSNS